MSIFNPVKERIGRGKNPRYRINHHCMRCNTILAFELTDRLGFRSHSEYWWQKGGLWLKERWYGNHVKCPVCGLEGNLPIDKPLAAEEILNKTEDVIDLDRRITQRLEEKKRKAKGVTDGNETST